MYVPSDRVFANSNQRSERLPGFLNCVEILRDIRRGAVRYLALAHVNEVDVVTVPAYCAFVREKYASSTSPATTTSEVVSASVMK